MPLRVLRYLDFAILLLALPIFVAADLPLLGWAGAAAGWTLQRVIQHAIEKRARESDDPRTVAVVHGVVELARGLGVATIAEGVETVEQLELLGELGCSYGQGFLFCRPLDAAAFEVAAAAGFGEQVNGTARPRS